MLETELFGHARGAFTGALQDRVGLFEAAHGGTLFFQQVRDVSPTLQVRLLRVLQAREVRRVGDVRLRHVDVRPIAATHRDLAAEVSQGRFRQDLYYRPLARGGRAHSLRERIADVDALLEPLLACVANRMGRPMHRYTDAARKLLIDYAWPENVRALEVGVERTWAVSEQPPIDVGDLPDAIQHRFVVEPPAGRSRPLREMEREYVPLIVRRHRGDRRRATEELPISLATRTRKLIGARRPHRYRGQALLNVSRVFGQDAPPLSTAFVAHGLLPTPFRNLEANIERSDAAIRGHASGIGTHIAARTVIDAAMGGGLTAIQRLEAVLVNGCAPIRHGRPYRPFSQRCRPPARPRRVSGVRIQPASSASSAFIVV